MKTKNIWLLALIVVLVTVYIILLTIQIGAAYNLSEWIVYGFVAPVIYLGVRLCTKLTDKNSLQLILGVSMGMLISLSLSRGTDAFLIYKIMSTIIGCVVSWCLFRIIK